MTQSEDAILQEGLPRSSYAYAPTADPATWKLPYLTASGDPDPSHLPGAAAAVSAGGFRGQKADIPASAIPGVKRKLRAAYKKWKGASADMPDSIKEGTVVLDRPAMSAQVVLCPNCATTLVVPPWEGAEEAVVACPTCSDPEDCRCDTCGCSDACHGEHAGEPVMDMDIDENAISSIASVAAFANNIVKESGRRHSSKDIAVLRQIAQLVQSLDIAEPTPEPEKDEESPVTESIEPVEAPVVEIAESALAEEIVFREAGASGELVTLSEAGAIFNPDKREIIITPIRPGWGNPKDGFYYPESALKEAVENGTFNSRPVKMYANHPARGAEAALPERSVWDWVSTMRETWWDAEKARPQSRIKVYDDRFWQRATQAPDEIAFSILGGGRSRRGRIDNREARIVESLSQIRSVDWVTEAGAGGAIEKFAESAHEEFEMDLKNLTAEQLKEGNPELYEAIIALARAASEPAETAPEAPAAEPVAAPEAQVTESEAEEAPAVVEETPAVVEEAPVVTDNSAAIEEMRKELDAVKKQLADKELAEAVAQNKAETAKFVADTIKESTLPAIAKNQVAEKFREATAGEGYLYASQDALKSAVERELAERQAIIDELTGGKSRVKVPSPQENPESSVRESVAKRLEDKWGAAPAPAKSSTETGMAASTSDEGDLAPVSEAAAAAFSRMADKFGLK